MWRLIFLFTTLISIIVNIYPFLIKFEIKINVLRLKGSFSIKVLFIKLNFKFRVKNGYVYIYFNKKEIKEKISNKNINLIQIIDLTKQMYFRSQLIELGIMSNFGYNLDSMITAVVSGYVNVISKCIFSKIKNNKKTAHIFVDVEPKYNEDIFNMKLKNDMRISLFDLTFAFLYSKYYVWRYKNEGNKKRQKNTISD